MVGRTNTTRPPYALNMREVYLQAINEMRSPYPSVKLCDWKIWNEITGGYRAREFTILCGATGAGKTAMLADQSAQLLKSGVKHFVMSVETGHTDFMKRVLSRLAERDLNSGDAVDPGLLGKVHVQNAQYLESDVIEFSLYDNRVKVEQLIHDLKFMHQEKGCNIAFIDNMNFFMEVTRASDTLVEMDRVVHELILFCKQIDMHLVMVMHPKKTEGEGRVLSEFDIKGSSTAVQEAHNVFLWNRPTYQDITRGVRNKYQRELTIKKMRRRGQHVNKTILFEFRKHSYVEIGVE